MLAQLVSSQSESGTPSSETTRVSQFMRLSPPTFTYVKVGEDPQDFIDIMEEIFWIMHGTDIEGMEFAAYQLKDMAYQ